ncbi:hypothetical protein GCM10011498_32260 [Amylibacter cionae]|uniref:Uncharacterized protein n=1 Tax=Neptunicoccus cionae TaxID=2035344 RepID=A0A916R3H6_9RHOB|nr:hypothetical protein GCM10011498_32260 [Amylibacter cionae]
MPASLCSSINKVIGGMGIGRVCHRLGTLCQTFFAMISRGQKDPETAQAYDRHDV